MAADLTVDIADDSGENPEDQHAVRQLKAGERVLTEVRREKNNLQDANTKLSVELKDVRAHLADSEKDPSGNTCFHCKEYGYLVVCGMYANLTIDVAGGPGVDQRPWR